MKKKSRGLRQRRNKKKQALKDMKTILTALERLIVFIAGAGS